MQNMEIFLEARDVLKIYGPTVAVNHLSITVHRGEVLALVGANGAGKSTITKILSGVVGCDKGEIFLDGKAVDTKQYTPAQARKKGIFVVHQELSLCRNLTVYENFYVEQYQQFSKRDMDWRKRAKAFARKALEQVFPGNDIDVSAGLAALSIAQQQMVEIARATCNQDVKMLILDEPTSSLPAEQTRQLQEYIKKSAGRGVSYIYISHRLKEIMYLADRIYIMQNGAEKYQCQISETDEDDMVRRMGSGIGEEQEAAEFIQPELNKKVSVRLNQYSNGLLKNITKEMFGGEIVCLTGLEGNGQLELLQDILFKSGSRGHGMEVNGKAAYVAGDRKKEGIFPLWSISDNTIISGLADEKMFRLLKMKHVKEKVDKWNGQLRTKCNTTDEPVVSLSGGNQQKVLIARALAVDADIILLDDPTRGVDLETKLALYEVFREAARKGKLVIWRTSDDSELEYGTRLCVMNNGTIAGEFNHGEYEHSSILKVAFSNQEKKDEKRLSGSKQKLPLYMFSLLTMILMYLLCGVRSSAIFSKFGAELLLVGCAPFIFGALAQTFIIGLGHIDLGVGAFMGLINVVCATILDQNHLLGIVSMAGLLLVYSCMGLLVYYRKVPPIIVTLGMSFVWTGLAYMLQAVPGGHVPQWMVKLFNPDNPVLQGILLWQILFMLLAVVLYRSRYGTVLRGFGNNETALRNSGWSTPKAYFMTYLIAGCFALMGGIAQSAITGASDVNASATYTMLTVAAVIIGGGYFSGGVVTHLGAVCGGVSLTLVSVILGLFRVSTDYTATIQGLVLIVILSIRLLRKEVL